MYSEESQGILLYALKNPLSALLIGVLIYFAAYFAITQATPPLAKTLLAWFKSLFKLPPPNQDVAGTLNAVDLQPGDFDAGDLALSDLNQLSAYAVKTGDGRLLKAVTALYAELQRVAKAAAVLLLVACLGGSLIGCAVEPAEEVDYLKQYATGALPPPAPSELAQDGQPPQTLREVAPELFANQSRK